LVSDHETVRCGLHSPTHANWLYGWIVMAHQYKNEPIVFHVTGL
jgi:hypothetical protein